MRIECLTGKQFNFENMPVGSVFKVGESFYILAHKLLELCNPDDQEDTLMGVSLLKLTQGGFEQVIVEDIYEDKNFSAQKKYNILTVDTIVLR